MLRLGVRAAREKYLYVNKDAPGAVLSTKKKNTGDLGGPKDLADGKKCVYPHSKLKSMLYCSDLKNSLKGFIRKRTKTGLRRKSWATIPWKTKLVDEMWE